MLTTHGEQTLFFGAKPGFLAVIYVKGMRIGFVNRTSFLFAVNKQLLVPFFIIKLLLNSYPEPEMADGL